MAHSAPLTDIKPALLRHAAIGGLFGGVAMFLLMAGYNAAQGMGFWSILNACFAALVYGSGSSSMMEPMGGHAATMMKEPIVASHLTVGAVLHVAMSATAGIAFAVVLATLIRAGIRPLATPLGYLTGAAIGGALLYVIMMYGVAPAFNSEIVDFTPRVPFFFSHLVFGAVAGGYAYWRCAPPSLDTQPAWRLRQS
jgi:hypothetical protein